MEPYKTPAGPATATLTEKKSEFIAQLSPAATEEEALAFLEGVRAAHRTANHNVYAYVLQAEARTRYSDDGEPAKTAGMPVLSAIQHAGLSNCIIVVTRYFGGTLLGTGGLVRAYGGAASAAIEKARVATVRPLRTLRLTLPYPLYEQARRLAQEAGARLDEPVFTDTVSFGATLPEALAEPLHHKLQELTRGGQGLEISQPFQDFWND